MSWFQSNITARVKSFIRSDDGNATISFALSFPVTMILFTIGYEGGLSSTRHVLLQHGLEETVREVRLGQIPQPTHDVLIDRICDHASTIPDCKNQVRLEMIRGTVAGWNSAALEGPVVCRNREDDENLPLQAFTNTGAPNNLMFLRACALFDPILPNFGFGEKVATRSGQAYALVATSGYVIEPF